MQHNKAPRADETYLTWQDLLDEEEGDGPTGAPGDENSDLLYGAAGAGTAVESPVALPPDVQALMTEKERLEGEMARLTGQAPPRPEEERMRRMYPVRVHTKETRIEDRRLRRHDEQQRMRKQRVLERKLVQARERQQQEELAALRKRRALEAALAKVRGEMRAAEAEEQRRRRAVERTLAEARALARQAERGAEKERNELDQALVHARWANDRAKALRKRSIIRSSERSSARSQQVEELDRRRTPAASAATEKPAPERNATTGAAGIQREQQQARVLAARRTEKAVEQAWEQAREEQRTAALARLRTARAEAAELDRRDQKRAQKRDRFEAGA
ncbi:MAG: hypothetical protein U0X20_12085 [Caldilineaceae bacterium]